MTDIQPFFQAIRTGLLAEATERLKVDPWLSDVVNKAPNSWDERQAMHCAAKHGQLEIVKLLNKLDAEIYPHTPYHYPPVIIAHWNDQVGVRDYFLKDIPDRAALTNGLGVDIVLAARSGWTDIVTEHTKRDRLAVHQRGPVGETALHWAAHNGSADVVKALLAGGADVEADEVGLYGGKPLHWASEHEADTVRMLLEYGADVNSRNTKEGEFCGFTPLMMNASQHNDASDVTEILISAGADLHARDASGKNALDHATEKELKAIPEVLRRHL
jgi:ankyrin repeat protein